MTAKTDRYIECDAPGVCTEYFPVREMEDFTAARMRAARERWTAIYPQGAPAKDYCPNHRRESRT